MFKASDVTLKEVVKDLAILLNYPKIVEKLESMTFDEIDL